MPGPSHRKCPNCARIRDKTGHRYAKCIKHLEELRPYIIKQYRKAKYHIIQQYGGECSCCGEKNVEFLQISRVTGHGNDLRRTIKNKARDLYAWLKKNGYPEGFVVLCANCNSSLGMYGYCPHNKGTQFIFDEEE